MEDTGGLGVGVEADHVVEDYAGGAVVGAVLVEGDGVEWVEGL